MNNDCNITPPAALPVTQLEEFDAYYKWLAIPPTEQPANYYRLLGVQLFEDNADVIDSAADARLNHLRTFQAGPRGEISQKISNEVSLARVTLLNVEKRDKYDSKLREEIAARERTLTPPSLPSIEVAAPPKFSGTAKSNAKDTGTSASKPEVPRRNPLSQTRTKILIATAIGAVVLFLIGGTIIWFAMTSQVDSNSVAQSDPDSKEPTDEDESDNVRTTHDKVPPSNDNASVDRPTTKNPDSETEPKISTSTEREQRISVTPDNAKSDSSDTKMPLIQSGGDSTQPDVASDSVPTPGTPVPGTPSPDSPSPDVPPPPSPDSQTTLDSNVERTDVFDLASNVRTPITPIDVELGNSVELFEVYETEYVKRKAIYLAAVSKLTKQAIDAVQAVAEESDVDQTTKSSAESIIESLNAVEPGELTIDLSGSTQLKKIVSKFNSELATHDKAFGDTLRPISEDYLDGINKISRELKRKRKNEQSNYLRNYIRLMQARTDQKPIAGQFVYFTNGGLNQAVYLNGEKLKFKGFASGSIRLNTDDIIAISYSSAQRNNAVNLAFVSSDKKLYVPILRRHVKKMPSQANPESFTRDLIEQRIGSLDEGSIDPALSQLHLNLGLPLENQGGSQWFSGQGSPIELFAISLSPDMLRSVAMDLAGLPAPDLEDMGELRSLKWNSKKRLMLVSGSQSESRTELPVFEQACKLYGLPYGTANSFNKDLADYSGVHTIVCGSNEMRYWNRQEFRDDNRAMQFIDKFVDDGGHLFMFGSFNAEGMESLAQFGIHTGFRQAQKFALAENGSALLLYGNRRLVPRDQELRSVGDFKCSVPHVPLLLRDDEYDSNGLVIATLEHGKGRVTLALVEPSYQNSMWIAPPVFSWIARGSPIPVSEIREGTTPE